MKERKELLSLVEECKAAGARQVVICDLLGISSRTIQRWRKDLRHDRRVDNRFAFSNALTSQERKKVLKTMVSPEFRDLGPHQIMPILADRKEYLCSVATMYRILHAEGLMIHRQNSRAPSRKKPVELIASGPNQVWTWDISYLLAKVKGKYYYLYMIMDIWDRHIVGWDIRERESGDLAVDLFRETCQRHCIEKNTLTLHQDNGSPMISAPFMAFLSQYEINPSYSRPAVSDDNPFSESLFRTFKYRPGYPVRFESIKESREWTTQFVKWYNNEHRHSKIGFVTPAQRRRGEDKTILANRKKTIEKARRVHPERWSGNVQKCEYISSVALNPRNKKKTGQKRAA